LSRWVRNRHRLEVTLHAEAAPEPPDTALRLLLFQAIRELLLNVAKHAGNTAVTLSVERVSGDRLQITVADRGVGFDVAARVAESRSGSGSGLWNIERRLGMMGGQIEIESAPGSGTIVRLVAPLQSAAPEAAAASAVLEAGGN
jgi:signal transduction histidine kinase